MLRNPNGGRAQSVAATHAGEIAAKIQKRAESSDVACSCEPSRATKSHLIIDK
jgi:hypothetical protein